ncbi:fibronectin type III domain-containing protein [Flavobacterium sp. B183]|uniref:fibronectin type III domain-containing protein n=1 Tax=Flavobacterium sp. B183 TaxID=907046 RepID=UPI00201EFC11|nr:fibronectin type III domain-containing protein [Flavobacterium sp. B183]URC11005.1 fibronectin type III domain-containing protein [Flavobacterium sp. B183]
MDKIQLPKMLKNLHLYLLLLCSLIGFEGFAQTFPISVTTQITQPSPIYLSKYADATTINSPIKIQLLLNDLNISNRQVRLKIYFQGNGVSFSNNDFVVGAKPLYLEGGFPLQLTNVDLAPYFQFQNLLGLNPNQYAQPLPEGISNFYVEVYDFATGKKLSRKTGTTTVIFQNEPPFLNLPLNNASIMQQNLQNIVFNWTPRSINVSNVEYEFSLVEIWDNYTPVQNAFAYSPPLYTTTTKMTTLQYGMSEPQLIPGKKYAWRIKAKAILGAEEIGVFKNNGYTEIFAFTYEVFCTSPLAIKTESIGQDQAKINWSGNIDNFDYQVNYREKNSGSEWYKAVTPRENITLSNLKPNTTYEYTVGSSCDVGKYIHSSIYEFTTIARDEIVFQGCGIKPDPKDLTNQTPLPELFPNDVISAGDFPIVVLHATGSNGNFSGDGYVTLPFLEKFRKLIDAAEALSPKDGEGNSKWNLSENTRIKITFDNIGLNTDFKLISGEIVAGYDASNWDKFLDVDDIADNFPELNIFGPNDSIPEDNSPKDNTTIPPVTVPPVNNPITTNPVTTNPVATNPVTTNPTTNTPSPGQTNPVATNPTNTTTPSPSQTNPTTEPPAPVKSNFKSIALTARENKTNRIAKEDEILYYVKEQFNTPKTSLALTIDPALPKSKIKDNVHWFRDETKIADTEGLLKFTAKDLDKSATIISLAGFPNEKSRKVNIKFVDKNAVAWSFVPPAVSQVLTKSFNEIDDRLQLLDRYVKIGRYIKMKVDPIKITGSKYNENDKESRLYKKMEVGSISGGISAETKEVLITHPVLDRLSRAGIVDIGLFFKAAFAVEVEGGVERYILVEQKKYQKNNPFLKVGPKGSLTFGVKAELKVARDQVKFEAKGAVEVAIKGDGTYNFSTNTLVVEGYIPPAILFANVQIGTKGFIEFELVDFQKSVELTDKIPLYEISHKF